MKRIIALAAALMLLAFTALSAAADMLGDVNGNGAIDAADYAMAKRQCLGTYEMTADELLRADINGNGAVDPTEYAMIKRHVLGTYTIEGEVETKHEHTPVTDAAVPASCTGTGLTEGSHCSVCGEVIVAQEVVPALGHEPNGNGVCTRCGKLVENENPASEGLEYRLNNSGDGYIVTGVGECTDTAIVIPAKYKDLPVVGIGNAAFSYCTSLTSITIPDSVTSIGVDAFEHCECLESITIPDSVTSIGYWAFIGCANLESIKVDKNNAVYHSSGNCLIETETKTLVLGCKNSILPTDGSVTRIGDGAFEYCKRLTSITIPDSVTSIGIDAFSYCTSLESITIPDSVTGIGYWAFAGCASLESITIPDSVTSIGDRAFSGCTSLESIKVDKNNAVYHSSGNCLIETETKTLVLGCKNSIIPTDGSVTSIGYWAFTFCSSLKSITIPDSVTIICGGAFYNCTALTSIIIPDSVTSIGDEAFYRCTSLSTVYYTGTEEQWEAIENVNYNDALKNATIVFNYKP